MLGPGINPPACQADVLTTTQYRVPRLSNLMIYHGQTSEIVQKRNYASMINIFLTYRHRMQCLQIALLTINELIRPTPSQEEIPKLFMATTKKRKRWS